MGYEIDFLSVGDKERSGDAIALRFGDLTGDGRQIVVVIDGGTQESGKELVDHIKKYYKTDLVNLVIATHSDQDHVSGLLVLLDELRIAGLWMHLPWDHSKEIVEIMEDGRVTNKSVEERIRKSLECAWDLKTLAEKKGIPVSEPFQGKIITDEELKGSLEVLGPSEGYYEELIPQFRVFQKQKEAGLVSKTVTAAVEAVKGLVDEWGVETIDDNDNTSAENNSSVVTLFRIEGQSILFTGDAGITALTKSADYADSRGIKPSDVKFIQAPHHGSKRNVGPTILNRIIGPKLNEDNPSKKGCVSAAKDGAPKHPSKRAMNAFRRRGVKMFSTQGSCLRHSENAPARDGWSAAPPLPFYDRVPGDE